MSRRRQEEEIAFGSDSFLDIVANIVGILIILIVIAGVRVSRMPVVSQDSETVAPNESAAPQLVATTAETPPEPSLPAQPPTDLPPLEEIAAIRPDQPKPVEEPVVPSPPPLSIDLVRQVHDLEEQMRELQQRQQRLTLEEVSLSSEQEELRDRQSTMRQMLQEKRADVTRGRLALADEEAVLESKLHDLATLQVTLAEVKADRPAPTVLKHKLTPVGREVSGEELHFQLSGGRVSVVPINELAEELKSTLQRKKSQILRLQRYVGSVGPIRGYRMDYVMEKRPASLIEELRMGTVVIRLGLSQFQIHPQSDVISETSAQALHPHGRFLTALRRAHNDATLTFWVYPDSFALHRELQEFAHAQGFEVAARPLPHGVPITGSPQGSRSVVQ